MKYAILADHEFVTFFFNSSAIHDCQPSTYTSEITPNYSVIIIIYYYLFSL